MKKTTHFTITLLSSLLLFGLACKSLAAEAITKTDGDLSEWKKDKPVAVLDQWDQCKENPGNWQGPDDLSGKFFFREDADYLSIAAEIKDNKPLYNPRETDMMAGWYKITIDGDALKVSLNYTKATADLVIFPGMYGTNPKVYVIKSPKIKSRVLEKAEVAVAYTAEFSGYTLEVKLPKQELGLEGNLISATWELYDSDGPASTCKSMKTQ